MKRRRTRLAAFLAVPCLVLAAAIPAAGSESPRATPSVIGGSTAFTGEFPFMAFIDGTRSSCSGSVVAPRVVLTAAHCVVNLNTGQQLSPNYFHVITGSTELDGPDRQVTAVTRVAHYPRFSLGAPSYGFGDAALLQLETPTTAPPVPLATGTESQRLIHRGTKVYVAGWGLTRPGNKDVSSSLIWAKLLISGTRCQGLRGRLCAIDFPKAVSTTCHGDSGGPLLAYDSGGQLIELGIIHAGYGRCSPRLPDLFTRVDSVGSWIRTGIQSLE